MPKYKILFLCGLSLLACKTFGQIQVGVEGAATVPLEFNFELTKERGGTLPIEMWAHTKPIGFKIAPHIDLQLNRHRISFTPAYFFLPEKSVNNEYLKYEVSNTTFSTFSFGYAYFLGKKIYFDTEIGLTQFFKPTSITAINVGLGLGYAIHKFEFKAGLAHIRKNGYLNLITIGVSYKILDNL